MKASVSILSWAVLSFVLWLGFVCASVAVAHSWTIRSRVAEGLSPSGAGLEFNEWLVNFLIILVIALILCVTAAYFTRRLVRSLRGRHRPSPTATTGIGHEPV